MTGKLAPGPERATGAVLEVAVLAAEWRRKLLRLGEEFHLSLERRVRTGAEDEVVRLYHDDMDRFIAAELEGADGLVRQIIVNMDAWRDEGYPEEDA
jgi:hypothetical protein